MIIIMYHMYIYVSLQVTVVHIAYTQQIIFACCMELEHKLTPALHREIDSKPLRYRSSTSDRQRIHFPGY